MPLCTNLLRKGSEEGKLRTDIMLSSVLQQTSQQLEADYDCQIQQSWQQEDRMENTSTNEIAMEMIPLRQTTEEQMPKANSFFAERESCRMSIRSIEAALQRCDCAGYV